VWGCKYADLGDIAKGVGQVVEKGRDGLGNAYGCEDTGAKKRVAAEAIVEGVLRARDVGVYPGQIGKLFQSKGGDRTFITFPYPLERQMVAVSVQGVR
jgi:hypothetical protein